MLETGPKIALVRFRNRFVRDIADPLNAFFVTRSNTLHNSVAGTSSWVGSRELEWVDAPDGSPGRMNGVAIGTPVLAFKQFEHQISIVFVGDQGQLRVVWRGRTFDRFNVPTRMVLQHHPAPVRAGLAAGRLPGDMWFVLFVDEQGFVTSLSVSRHHHWLGPERVPSPGLAQPGSNLIALNQTRDLLSVLFVERTTRHVHVIWRRLADAVWKGPASIHSVQTTTPPGAGMAAAQFLGDVSYVLFVDDRGALRATHVVGLAPWNSPADVSAPDFAPPGAPVAAVAHSADLISAFVVGIDGALYAFNRARDDTSWSAPLRLTPPDAARPGASVSAARQDDALVVVAFEAIDARPTICRSVGGRRWLGPAPISWMRIGEPHVARMIDSQASAVNVSVPVRRLPDVQFVRTRRVAQLTGVKEIPPGGSTRNPMIGWGAEGVDLGANTEHTGPGGGRSRLFCFFGDVTLPYSIYEVPDPAGPPGALAHDPYADPDQYPPWDGDLIAYTEATGLAADGFPLIATTRHGAKGASEEPAEHIYHPFTVDRLGPLVTVETPTGAFSYSGRCYVFVVIGGWPPIAYLTSSDRPELPIAFRMHGVFSGLSRQSTELKSMQVAPVVVRNGDHPGLPLASGDGVVMVSHGSGRNHTDGMFLAWMPLSVELGPDRSRLLYYAGRAPGGTVRWSPVEADAEYLFPPPKPGYTSVSFGWLRGPRRWVLLYSLDREGSPGPIVARLSSDLFLWSDEVRLFDAARDTELIAQFPWQQKSAAYGAFLLDRFHKWHPESGTMTLTYLMSSFRPYQVHVMQSQIVIANAVTVLVTARRWLALSVELIEAGKRRQSLAAAQSAVEVLRRNAVDPDPDLEHRVQFAIALHTLALRWLDVGERERAAAAAAEATQAYREAAAMKGADISWIAGQVHRLQSIDGSESAS